MAKKLRKIGACGEQKKKKNPGLVKTFPRTPGTDQLRYEPDSTQVWKAGWDNDGIEAYSLEGFILDMDEVSQYYPPQYSDSIMYLPIVLRY